MKKICMCEEHSKMIKESSKDELLVILEHQLDLINEATRFIDLLKDENSILPVILEQSTQEVISQMEKVRYNARLVFNFTEEELRSRLSTHDEVCLVPAIPGYTTHVHANGTVTRTRGRHES